MPPAIVVVGSLNMDLVMRVPRVPRPGETLAGRSFAMSPGGKGANQAVACARLGASVAIVGRVGDDTFGEQLRGAMRTDSIDVGALGTDPGATGVALIMVNDAAENCIALAAGANGAVLPGHVDAAGALIDHAAMVILQLEIPLDAVMRAITRAARAGGPVLLNPAPAAALPDDAWTAIDILVPNETEASALTGLSVRDPGSAAIAGRLLRARGVRQVAVTLGAQGVVVADENGERHHRAMAVDAIDTTAAGDAFIGGLAVGLCETMTLDQAVRFGIAASGICVTRHGAQSAMPYRRELPDEFAQN